MSVSEGNSLVRESTENVLIRHYFALCFQVLHFIRNKNSVSTIIKRTNVALSFLSSCY